MNDKELMKATTEAREMAYVPYSGFAVGAAFLTADGRLYQGYNIENAVYTPSNCAERTAFFKAVGIGERSFATITIVGGKRGAPISEYCTPCDVYRQVMMGFCDPDTFRTLLAKSPEEWQFYTLKELLPFGFSGKNLDR